MSITTVSLRHLDLQLGNRVILDDISTDFHAGELTVLLGPNGTGKSSLLKLITREWPINGEVHYFGKDSQHWKPSDIATHLGVLPQSSSLSFNFSVREVVELGGLVLNASQKDIVKLAQNNMEKTDVSHLAERLYPSLSGGEKQRVHLARVLTQLEQSGDQKVLLLDEPTSALDLSHQHKTLSLAKLLTEQGATVITVMHDLNLAAQYADRVLILNNGKLVADGTPWETLTQETISDVYQWATEIIPHPTLGHPVILS